MIYKTPLSAEAQAAYVTMPRDDHGHVVSLQYVPLGRVSDYEARWRDWMSKTPKHLWPSWSRSWKDVKRLRGIA